LSGTRKDYNAKYLFATIQTISRTDYLSQFKKDEFDYILIDEVHRAGASSYERVLDYFKPEFLLGMTATPERTDDYNIYKLFDYITRSIRRRYALYISLCWCNLFRIYRWRNKRCRTFFKINHKRAC